MEIDKVLFDESYVNKTDKSFEELDVNNDGKINSEDLSLTDNNNIKSEISKILEYDIDEETELINNSNLGSTNKTSKINTVIDTISTTTEDEPATESPAEQPTGLYYVKGKLANGEQEINGTTMYFKNGKPSAGVVKKESTQYNYTSKFPTKIKVKTQTVYGDDGKLLTGEYNHKMYKNGKLLTGPLNGNYYVKGVQDDTFSGKGTDGLMYDNGKPLTGTKNSKYYYNGKIANGQYDGLYYIEGKLANGEQEINGTKMYFKNGKPSAGAVIHETKSYNYTSKIPTPTTVKTQTVYGDDGKLLTGEYNHKMYKDGKLLTGPLNGNYYVKGIQDDTFSGKGTDGLMYDNGKVFTGIKNSKYYYNGKIANGQYDGLYYIDGKLANGEQEINGTKMYFKNGKPSAGAVIHETKSYNYTSKIPTPTTVKTQTVYGDDGKLLTGEYNHKMYKDGQLLTGPYNGNYYVKGIQDDTFTGKGTDGLMYDNGKVFTGIKNSKYYHNGKIANGQYDGLYYIDGKLANGEQEINDVKMHFTSGRPSAGVVTKESAGYDYTGKFPRRTTIKTKIVYGDDGKLLTGEYNHKMYKDGQLLTGPYNGNYYVKGVQDDTFSGKGSDGLMYDNGKPLTGTKNSIYYKNGVVADGYVQ